MCYKDTYTFYIITYLLCIPIFLNLHPKSDYYLNISLLHEPIYG